MCQAWIIVAMTMTVMFDVDVPGMSHCSYDSDSRVMFDFDVPGMMHCSYDSDSHV